MGLLDWLLGSKPKGSNEQATLPPAHLAKGRGYTFEVVGESHRQAELNSICGGKCEDGHDLMVTAQLVFIDGNPHDPNAIGVFVNAKMVGYVPRHLTADLRSEILRINPDERPVTCDGRIVGGWDRGDGDEGHYGIKLSLSNPLRVRR